MKKIIKNILEDFQSLTFEEKATNAKD